MKFSASVWSVIFSIYKFKRITKYYVYNLRYERNSNIPYIFLKFKKFYLHNGKKLRYIRLNKYKAGYRFGYYLLTRSLSQLKKKKRENMGQKGKFLSHRAGYSNLWNDLWYIYRGYHGVYFQNLIIKELIMYLMATGLSTTSIFLSPFKKCTNLLDYKLNNVNLYLSKIKTDFNSSFWGREFVRQLQGIYLTKLHIVKNYTNIIISGAGYKWGRQKQQSKRLIKVERRICLFYSSILLLDNLNHHDMVFKN